MKSWTHGAMTLIRSSLFFVLFVLNTLVFGLILSILGWFLPAGWKEALSNTWAIVTIAALKATCGLGYRVRGRENIPREPRIIMSKHQSAWETMALRAIFRGSQSWVLKRELMWVPVFGWALATMSPIAIDRKTGRHAVQQIAEQGTRHLHAGRHVMIFPEGTRVAPGQRGRYRLGGGVLAQEAGFPVIPVAHNAGVFWKRRALYKHPGTIDVVIGPPIETRGRDATEIMADVENWIEGQMERLPASPDSAASEPAT